MEDLKTALLSLQDLDNEIVQARAKLLEFKPQLDELDQPLSALETEVTATRTRLAEMREKARKLESAAEQKRQRLRAYEERLMRVRNSREEAAAKVEMDLIRRAADADDQEALEMMEQRTRTDLKLDDMQKQLEKLRSERAPMRDDLLRAREDAEQQLKQLLDRRQNMAIRLDAASLRLYERVRSGRAATALAPLTDEGACGHCFNILPLQEQSEIRNGTRLRRCEACGVILYAS
jgi:predicted  nucleic acid-binding Zn-ribbon protein